MKVTLKKKSQTTQNDNYLQQSSAAETMFSSVFVCKKHRIDNRIEILDISLLHIIQNLIWICSTTEYINIICA